MSSSMIPVDASPSEVIKALGSLVVAPSTDDLKDDLKESDTDASNPATPSTEHPPELSGDQPLKPITKKPKKKKRTPKLPPCPDIKLFVGQFVHSTSEGEFVVMSNKVIGVKGGRIVFIEEMAQLDYFMDLYQLRLWESQCVIRMEHGSFMMPGMIDCYCQPLSSLSAAFSDTDHSLTSASSRSKLHLVHDDRIAKRHLRRVVERSLACGTTCVLYNGSHIESAARVLADSVGISQQRAYVGLDVACGDYRDDTHMFQLTKAYDIVQYIKRTQLDTVQPCLVLSHPLPTWLLERFRDITEKENIPIVCSVHGQSEEELKRRLGHWVQFEEKSPLELLQDSKLIDDKCILVHSQHMSPKERKLIQAAESRVVYCPAHDLSAAPYWTNLKALTSTDLCLGVGSDNRNKHSVLSAVQDYSLVKQLQERMPRPPEKREKIENGEVEGEKEIEEYEEEGGPIDVGMARMFYMATLGGAKVLGLEDQIGNFEIGKEFDAILVDTLTTRSSFQGVHRKDTIPDLVQKFLLLGDEHNVSHVYIRGTRIK